MNTFYGQVNRTGLIVAGAALLGFSGKLKRGKLGKNVLMTGKHNDFVYEFWKLI